MGNKQDYKLRNKRFLQEIKKKEGILALEDGVMADIIKKGEGSISPSVRSIVTCKYKGSLITGEVFDSNWENEYPEAFRVNELIEGFQIGIQAMHQGDIFRIYIPYMLGYGNKRNGNIPACSTLIFEVELIGVM
mgnify:FL=1